MVAFHRCGAYLHTWACLISLTEIYHTVFDQFLHCITWNRFSFHYQWSHLFPDIVQRNQKHFNSATNWKAVGSSTLCHEMNPLLLTLRSSVSWQTLEKPMIIHFTNKGSFNSYFLPEIQHIFSSDTLYFCYTTIFGSISWKCVPINLKISNFHHYYCCNHFLQGKTHITWSVIF